jgi:hypothetical protein
MVSERTPIFFIQIVSRLALLRLSSDSNGVRTMLACLERGDAWLRLPSEYLAKRSHKIDAAAGVTISPRLLRERDDR